MGFREGMCPKCHERIQVPDDRDKILCMYCGQEVDTAQAVSRLEEHQAFVSASVSYQELYGEVKEDFVSMLDGISDPMKNFKKQTYEDMFKEYYRQNLYIIEGLDKAYCVAEDKEAFVAQAAGDFVARAKERIDAETRKTKRDDLLFKCNMSLVIYIFPAILEYKGASGQALTDKLVEVWNASFEKANINSCSFDNINGGFKRRWCYITTAVCETLNKGDDCYELNLLRNYRDGYLMQTEDGADVVREYYDVAPTIVKRIGRLDNSKEVYQGIYDRYLKTCVQLIEEDQKETCRDVYTGMVNDLKKEYFITNKRLS